MTVQQETLLMLPEKKLTYSNGILTLVDGHLNPCFFHAYPDRRSPEQEQKENQESKAREKIFKETYRKLYRSAKRITITFTDGHIAVLDLKDKEYGWCIRWSTRDLLKQAVIPKKLGFNQYGTLKANELSVERKSK